MIPIYTSDSSLLGTSPSCRPISIWSSAKCCNHQRSVGFICWRCACVHVDMTGFGLLHAVSKALRQIRVPPPASWHTETLDLLEDLSQWSLLKFPGFCMAKLYFPWSILHAETTHNIAQEWTYTEFATQCYQTELVLIRTGEETSDN